MDNVIGYDELPKRVRRMIAKRFGVKSGYALILTNIEIGGREGKRNEDKVRIS